MYSCPIPKLTKQHKSANCRLLAAQAGGYPSICWARPLHQLLRKPVPIPWADKPGAHYGKPMGFCNHK